MSAVRDLVERTPGAEVPPHLRSGATAGERAMGHGVGYVYPHDHPEGIAAQQYLPDEIADAVVFHLGKRGEEVDLGERLDAIDDAMGKHRT
jgi:putative ATPase